MIENETIKHQLNHKSIRAFKDVSLSEEQLTTLLEVARHTSTSMFMQQFSIVHITDAKKRQAIQDVTALNYAGGNGDLFIFVLDLYRNQQIRQQSGNDDGRLHTTDIFFQALQDTVLAVQNTLNAAESMGLGGVILGKINDDPQKMVRLLNLPPLTLPVLGLQVGVPAQKPQLKPRLPLAFTTFENTYQIGFKATDLKAYDKVVRTYYDLRDANRRIDSFTHQINGKKLAKGWLKRDEIVTVLHQQGLALDFEGDGQGGAVD